MRVAMGAQNDGSFLKDPNGNVRRMETVVEAAIVNGLYVIVDWHSHEAEKNTAQAVCLLYTSPSPRDLSTSRMPSSA